MLFTGRKTSDDARLRQAGNHSCYNFSEMHRYNWPLVLLRNFFALVCAFCFAIISYSGSELSAQICNPTWRLAFSFVVIVLSTLAVIEVLHWTAWFLWEQFQQDRNHLLGAAPRILFKPFRLKVFVLGLVAGGLLLLLSAYVGGPTPCAPVRSDRGSWRFFVGSLAFGVGLLSFANGLVYEDHPSSSPTAED
jgi:hypothetical protein